MEYPKSYIDTMLEEKENRTQGEDIVLNSKNLNSENRWDLLKLFRNLEEKAQPGNWAMNKLENSGYSIDYDPRDHGTHESDNE